METIKTYQIAEVVLMVLPLVFTSVGCERKLGNLPEPSTLTESVEQTQSLHDAALSGDIEQVKLLISKGTDINMKTEKGATALHFAAQNGHKEVAEVLIASGSDINAKDGSGWTPLHEAAFRGHKDVVELLVSKGVDINAKNRFFAGWTSLHKAAAGGNTDVAKLLIASGADVNAKSNLGDTPLDVAMSNAQKDVAVVLIAKGAPVSTLHVAVFIGDLSKITSFIRAGVDVNAKDKRGHTPLHFANGKGVAEFLIAIGADIHAKDRGAGRHCTT